MRTDTIFRIASMTKSLTVAGVMILVDEARLSLLDPVEQFLPEFKGIKVNPCGESQASQGCDPVNATRPITVLDLMTHTSGLPGQGAAGPEPFKSLAERVSVGAHVAVAGAARHEVDLQPNRVCGPGTPDRGLFGKIV